MVGINLEYYKKRLEEGSEYEFFFSDMPDLCKRIEEQFGVKVVPAMSPLPVYNDVEYAIKTCMVGEMKAEDFQDLEEKLGRQKTIEECLFIMMQEEEWLFGADTVLAMSTDVIKAIGSDKKYDPESGNFVTVHNELTYQPVAAFKLRYAILKDGVDAHATVS